MAGLFIKQSSGDLRELQLHKGTNRFGRAEGNDQQIKDGTVSSAHCEVNVSIGGITIRDLGSTNGTFINGARIQEAPLLPGQTLRLGDIELILSDNPQAAAMAFAASVAAAEPVKKPALAGSIRIATPIAQSSTAEPQLVPQISAHPDDCPNHPGTLGNWGCQRCHKRTCRACHKINKVGSKEVHTCAACGGRVVDLLIVAARELTFKESLGSAIKYPFKGSGLLLIFLGTFLYLLGNFVWMLPMRRMGISIVVFSYGYLFAYMQKIIVASANGEDELPSWPDLSDFHQDIIQPFLLFAGTLFISFGPAIVGFLFISPLVGLPLLVAGLLFFPMALLAVAMGDAITALNPLVICSSILKIKGPYFAACLLLGFLVAASWILSAILNSLPIPILPWFIEAFASLFFVVLEIRILGLLYYTNRRRLGWF
jgi:hypothetical protein